MLTEQVLTYEHDYGRGVPVRSGNGIQFWQGAQNIEVYNNRLWRASASVSARVGVTESVLTHVCAAEIYDTALTNQGIGCVAGGGTPEACAMTNISWHHNLVTTNAMVPPTSASQPSSQPQPTITRSQTYGCLVASCASTGLRGSLVR